MVYPVKINYTASQNVLQTLDLWLPNSISGPEPVIFLIYLHGGAWVDPEQDSREGHCLLNCLHQYAGTSDIKIACASINYRLSTPGSGIKHPDHQNDVETAMMFLQKNYGLEHCILIGHSAGATLAVQIFHQFRREIDAMVLFNGIYDLVALVDEYPEYNGFVSAAFGDLDRRYSVLDPVTTTSTKIFSDWQSPSPTHIMETTTIPRRNLREPVVLAHSAEDELLSMRQTDAFETVLRNVWSGPIKRILIHGKHDDSPQSREMQKICLKLVRKVSAKVLDAAARAAEEEANRITLRNRQRREREQQEQQQRQQLLQLQLQPEQQQPQEEPETTRIAQLEIRDDH